MRWPRLIRRLIPPADTARAPVVDIVLSDVGKGALAAFTAAHGGGQFVVVLDGRVIAVPVILAPIPGGLASTLRNSPGRASRILLQ